MVVVFPIAVGLGVLAHNIVTTLYKEQYLNSVFPLQILLVSLIFVFLSGPVTTLLNACDRQITQTGIIAFVAVVNIALNIIFIPHFGVVAAAFAALVGNFLILAIGYYFVPKIIPVSHSYLLKSLGQVFVSTAVMGLGVWYVNQSSNFMLAILVGAVIYPVMIFVTKAMKKQDILTLLEMIKK
jgi:O-antigen/teichoic acid export membrane protein